MSNYSLFENSSLSTLRKIFPLIDFGIVSMNLIPPLSFLWGATFSSTKLLSSSSFNDSSFFTTKAKGTSPASSLRIPMTAVSATLGWDNITFSNSAGGTYNINKNTTNLNEAIFSSKNLFQNYCNLIDKTSSIPKFFNWKNDLDCCRKILKTTIRHESGSHINSQQSRRHS